MPRTADHPLCIVMIAKAIIANFYNCFVRSFSHLAKNEMRPTREHRSEMPTLAT